MFDLRHHVRGTLTVCAPLHVGSGTVRHLAHLTANDTNRPIEVAAIARDHLNRPYLPRTTVKGLLRRVAEDRVGDKVLQQSDVDELFGVIKRKPEKDKSSGAMGRLLVRGGNLISAGDAQHMPHGVTHLRRLMVSEPDVLGAGVFLLARTAIEPGGGIAAAGRLFHAEAVAPDTKFELDLLLLGRGEKSEDKSRSNELLDKLVAILDRLTNPNGTPCGRGQADGMGALRLESNSVQLFSQLLNANGSLTHANLVNERWSKRTPVDALTNGRSFHFICNNPMLIKDSFWDPKAHERYCLTQNQSIDNIPQVIAQKSGASTPLVTATSLSGVLRARARWLAAVAVHRANPQARVDASCIDPSSVDQSRVYTLGRGLEPPLTAVEELFGLNGYRGLVQIEGFKVSGGQPTRLTSVKLDSFSGAPVHEALFTTGAFFGVQLSFSLRLKSRRKADGSLLEPSGEAIALFERLLADIDKGFMLGHGGSKGFGWFEKRVPSPAPQPTARGPNQANAAHSKHSRR